MKSRLLVDGDERVFVLVFGKGEEAKAGLMAFALGNNLQAAHFTAVGAFQKVDLGYFDPQAKAYQTIPVNEQVEVLSLAGNVTEHEGKPTIHAHVVVGKRDGTAHGGHLMSAIVNPTLEIMLTEAPQHLTRVKDPETGLAFIRLD